MTLSPLIRPDARLLAQHLVTCPGCHQPAAAHVDLTAGGPVLVRFVCPDRCAVDAAAILIGLTERSSPLSGARASG